MDPMEAAELAIQNVFELAFISVIFLMYIQFILMGKEIKDLLEKAVLYQNSVTNPEERELLYTMSRSHSPIISAIKEKLDGIGRKVLIILSAYILLGLSSTGCMILYAKKINNLFLLIEMVVSFECVLFFAFLFGHFGQILSDASTEIFYECYLASAQRRWGPAQPQVQWKWIQDPNRCMASNSPFRIRFPSTIYSFADPTQRCGRTVFDGLTDEEKRAIVDEHNRLRMKVARGEEFRGAPGPQPKPVRMETLVWDNKLAEAAQKLAYQCEMKHDKCRHYPEESVGQNLASIERSDPQQIRGLSVVKEMVNRWYEEVKYYNRNSVKSFNSLYGAGGKQTGHYTQLVWAETNRVGCGAMKYFQGGYYKMLLVCNYAPAGNVQGMPVYRTL
ncbi:hypothetical protein TKK_0007407 [Trichogramma kaykai]